MGAFDDVGDEGVVRKLDLWDESLSLGSPQVEATSAHGVSRQESPNGSAAAAAAAAAADETGCDQSTAATTVGGAQVLPTPPPPAPNKEAVVEDLIAFLDEAQ